MDKMEKATKFYLMLELLRSSQDARLDLVSDPSAFLRDVGLTKSVLNAPRDKKAIAKSETLIAAAKLSPDDDFPSTLKKLGAAAAEQFQRGYDIEVDAFGVKLLERLPETKRLFRTATATVACTWSPWDGCGPDGDF